MYMNWDKVKFNEVHIHGKNIGNAFETKSIHKALKDFYDKYKFNEVAILEVYIQNKILIITCDYGFVNESADIPQLLQNLHDDIHNALVQRYVNYDDDNTEELNNLKKNLKKSNIKNIIYIILILILITIIITII